MGKVQDLVHGGKIVAVLPAAADLVIEIPVLAIGELSGGYRHGGTLGVVVVAAGVVLVVVAVEEGDVHLGRDFVDGIEPILSPAVVVTVVEQGLMGDDEQGAILVHGGDLSLEVLDGLGNGGSVAVLGTVVGAGGVVETGGIAVVSAGIGHAQGEYVVVAVVGGAVDAVIAGTIDQAAGLVQGDLLAGVVVSAAVVVGPGVVDGDAVAQHITDIAGDGVGISRIGAFVAGECVTAAGDGREGQTGILKRGHDILHGALLVVAVAGVQVREDDRRIHDSRIIRCECLHGDHAEHHDQNQQHGEDAGLKVSCVHSRTSVFFPKFLLKA